MSYGLAAAVLPPTKLDDLMQGLYYKILPLLGVNRCITKPWRMLPEKFQGLGLPNFVVDCLAAKLHFILCNWGLESTSGTMMMHAYEAFMMEVGLYGNVLSQDFSAAGSLATDGTWFKNLWEFCSCLDLHLDVAPSEL